MVSKKLYGYYHDDKQYEQIRAQITSIDSSKKFNEVIIAPSSNGVTQEVEENVTPYTVIPGDIKEIDVNGNLSDYSYLKEQNNELVGWIQIPGFKKPINYPIMQAEDNDFYLHNDFYKNFSYAGSIFMDISNDSSQVDRNIIIYGHAMKNMSMFGNLKEFPNRPEDYMEKTKVYIDLMNTRLEYEVFSIYFTDAAYNYRQTSFSNDEEYFTFLKRICLKSVYKYNVELSALDKILTLSTCNSDLGKDMRSVTHARLVKQIIYNKITGVQSEIPASEHTIKEVVSANFYLTQLSLNYCSGDKQKEAVLNPSFANAYNKFSAQLPTEAEVVSLSFTKADPVASVSVTLNEEETDPLSMKLKYGENVIKIKVVSRDKQYIRIYTIIAVRIIEVQSE
jgi:sortase B